MVQCPHVDWRFHNDRGKKQVHLLTAIEFDETKLLTASKQTLAALWPEYRNVPNKLPESAQVTTLQMVSFLLFFVLQIPFHFIPIGKLRYFAITYLHQLGSC